MNFSNITTPGNYSNGAFLAQEAGRGLLSRLDLMKLNPRHILDMGCGAGLDIISLKEKFPQSLVSGIDLAREFLQAGKKYGAMIQADASILPLRS
ncbi:MAG TPA: class I SAM-dependent methyltransferase, partial [Gammaproteobacteria bacterium]|nr:class I SAM-dependent methyltransferase [Gammaproteobacteria bacterium]